MAAPAPAPLHAVPPLIAITRAFPKRRVLVVGDLVADHYVYGHTERISREAPVLVLRYDTSEVKLGGGANAAANARSLGGQVTAVGVLGKDEMGRALRKEFTAAGIRLKAAASTAVQTETKTRYLGGGVSTTRQQMLRLDRGNEGVIPPKLRVELARQLAAAARAVDAVVVSDYGAGVVGDEVRAVLRDLVADGMPVCVDSRYQLATFTGMTVCKPNEPELEALSGKRIRSEAELREAGREAIRRLRCKALLVTRGHHGMALFDARGGVEWIPVHGAEEAVDVTGAGDTVVAALTLGLATGASIGDAARIANVAGGLVVQKQGTATVSRDELVRALGGGAG